VYFGRSCHAFFLATTAPSSRISFFSDGYLLGAVTGIRMIVLPLAVAVVEPAAACLLYPLELDP
jgi:hypothetical protein